MRSCCRVHGSDFGGDETIRRLLWSIGTLLVGILLPVNSWIPKESKPFLGNQQPFNRFNFVGSTTGSSGRIDTALWDFSGRREFLEQLAASTAAAATSTANPSTATSTNKRGAAVNQPKLPNSNRTGSGGGGRRNYLLGEETAEEPTPTTRETRGSSGGSSSSSSKTALDTDLDGSGKQSSATKTQSSSGRSPKGTLGGKTFRGGGTGSSGSNCFPADAWVEVYIDDDEDTALTGTASTSKNHRWRRTLMKDLVLGDRVRTGLRDTDISTVYAFGTKDPEATVVFDRLVTESGRFLELTENHIVFSVEETTAAAAAATVWELDGSEVAWDIEVGDSLPLLYPPQNDWNGTRVVRRESIEKQGAYHPYTLDGKLMVNGFQVSVHSIDSRMPYLSIAGCPWYDLHGFQQLLFTPLRLLVRWSPSTYSSSENHDPVDGSHHYVDIVESLQIFLLPVADEERTVNFASGSSLIALRITVLLLLIGCDVLERLLVAVQGWWLLAAAFCLGMTVLLPPKKKKSSTLGQQTPTAGNNLEEFKSKQS